MTYYIFFPGDRETNDIADSNILGEVSFNSFYSGSGFRALHKIVNNNPELLAITKIKTDQNETLSVEEFLNRIRDLKIY